MTGEHDPRYIRLLGYPKGSWTAPVDVWVRRDDLVQAALELIKEPLLKAVRDWHFPPSDGGG